MSITSHPTRICVAAPSPATSASNLSSSAQAATAPSSHVSASVQSRLGLRPKESHARETKNRELVAIAHSLEDTCSLAGRPPPHVDLPHFSTIRKLDPRLGNRIAAFPGRNGYNRLAEYIRSRSVDASQPEPLNPDPKPTGNWGVWTDPQTTRAELLAYQLHPQVLPRLCSLPVELSGAIQRQGGASVFASREGMVLDKNWANILRLSRLVRWLADEVNHEENKGEQISEVRYFNLVQTQCTSPPPFPSAARICKAGLATDVQRYGGRKALAVRLGFSRVHGIRDLFMGPFSVQLAADVLDFAVRQVDVASDGSVVMPTIRSLEANGKGHIANVVETLGGEIEVGRRLGLVPLSALRALP